MFWAAKCDHCYVGGLVFSIYEMRVGNVVFLWCVVVLSCVVVEAVEEFGGALLS